MWSLTRRTKRISSFRKFRLLPPKDFFASIDPKRTGAQPRHTQSSAQSVWPGRHCKRFFAVGYYKLLAAQPVNKPSLGVSGGPCRWELDMAGLGICSAVLTFVGTLSAADAWAADVTPTKVPPATTTPAAAPRACTDPSDFFTTDCQLTWQGITLFGIVDTGVGWQSHGAPFDPRSAVGSSYLIQKQNGGPIWTLAPNALSNSTIGIKGIEPIGGNFSVVFDLDAGFDPYSPQFSNGAGSIAASNGIPQNLQGSYSDSSRAGQWNNGQGYVGVSSPTYGTLTVFRQNSLTLDAVFDYDPFGASYAFSPIGFQGITCGGGNTQNCRNSTSLKYRINVDHFRAAALWQFGGYGENNASNGAYQFQVGADVPTWGRGVLSAAAIYSHVKYSVALSFARGSNNAFGMPIPPFLPQTLTATISDASCAFRLSPVP